MNDLEYVLAHHEEAVLEKSGRKPSGRPLLLWASGRVRVEFLGTYKTVKDARLAIDAVLNAKITARRRETIPKEHLDPAYRDDFHNT